MILRAAYMIASKPHSLDAELRTEQLRFLGKEHQTGNGQTAKYVRDMSVLQHNCNRHIKLVGPLAENTLEILIERFGINVIFRRAVNTIFINLILVGVLHQTANL